MWYTYEAFATVKYEAECLLPNERFSIFDVDINIYEDVRFDSLSDTNQLVTMQFEINEHYCDISIHMFLHFLLASIAPFLFPFLSTLLSTTLPPSIEV